MVKKLISILVSTRLTAFLFISFSVAMAAGTFIESFYGTDASKILVYNAIWFEIMMLLFVVNFIYNIKRYNLLRKEKLAVLVLHLSWILIIIGAGITRYIGHEGMMPIREGSVTNEYLTNDTYLTVLVDGKVNGQPLRKELNKKVLFSEFYSKTKDTDFIPYEYGNGYKLVDHIMRIVNKTAHSFSEKIVELGKGKNHFNIKNNFDNEKFNIEFLDFFENAEKKFVQNNSGKKFLKLVEASSEGRHDHFLEDGKVSNIHGVLFSLNNKIDDAINITADGYDLFIESPSQGSFLRMIDQYSGTIEKNIKEDLQYKSLYNIAGIQFVIPEPIVNGDYKWTKTEAESDYDLLTLKINSKDEEKIIEIPGGKGISNEYVRFTLENLDFSVKYGSLLKKLPFSLKLNDFIAEKYPGTVDNYSSFKSKVTVEGDTSFDYEIYMNHILNHKGYRFFQASFYPDELGTVLSVNKDFYGTLITYIGYILLYIGLLGIMLYGKTRFKDLSKKLDKLKSKRINLSIILLFFSFNLFSQQAEYSNDAKNFSLNFENKETGIFIVDKDHAAKFGELVIQDSDGRMKPINTFASEFFRKLSKSESYKELNPEQILLSILKNPIPWESEPIIYLKRGNDSIRSLINVNSDVKYAAWNDFFQTKNGKYDYKLADQVKKARESAVPNQFEKDFLDLNKKLSLLDYAFARVIYRIFPKNNDSNYRWDYLTFFDDNDPNRTQIDNLMKEYFYELDQSVSSKDYSKPNEIINKIKDFQNKYGSEVIPSDRKIEAEILYNKIDIFKRLFYYYLLVGSAYFIFIILQIFNSNKLINNIYKNIFKGFKILIFGLFIIHTFGLIARGYISGHAPWSDAYESMIYVAWATMGIALFFSKKSDLTLASTSFIVSMILMIAHWNWMDPSIANLQPVLDSYWLMIHVSIIVGSYGPFAIGMILGIVSLFLIILSTSKNSKVIKHKLSELTIINELALTIGLVMLTIGNFLGGMWANESWGRYWGWDPKETWALISILIYAFVLHLRLIPKMRGIWLFNLMSIIAFASIVMTYFGVNFYLVGLHSYASGDKVITPDFVYYSILFVFILGVISKYKYNKFIKN